ncbi:uncharacterized protein N7483_012368 [Penicillium malachiteum]|uniref:uncharacterized protein n=1 Tax=Penicillium malachiteum TaxID=1324776 RepID=UPI002546A44C|nr:uncharacterized protein N7483_012368 [Penicillium malachiteum]KAJ5715187.1 hypothetical protein N7483_012368 [Penicillium malachiteum]
MQDWAKKYGEVYRVRIGPVEQYMLNSDRAVKHLMDRNSSFSSARPRIVAGELLANNGASCFSVPIIQDGKFIERLSPPTWPATRKPMPCYLPFIKRLCNGCMRSVMTQTMEAISRTCGQAYSGTRTVRTFAQQMVGLPWPRPDHESMRYMHYSGLLQILATFPLANLVEVFPWLEPPPLFLKPWQRWARKIHADDIQWARKPTDRVQKLMGTDRQPVSLLTQSLMDNKMLGFESRDEASISSVQLIGAAADTSQMLTWSFLEAMMTFPNVQRKAQQKIDEAVGDCIPTWEHFHRIPYVRSLMKETWRWGHQWDWDTPM